MNPKTLNPKRERALHGSGSSNNLLASCSHLGADPASQTPERVSLMEGSCGTLYYYYYFLFFFFGGGVVAGGVVEFDRVYYRPFRQT